MTLVERAGRYAEAFPQYVASHLHVVSEKGQPVLYGTWVLGNDYRATGPLYGAYPPSYLKRVMALFPDIEGGPGNVLHAYSGALPPSTQYARCDSMRPAEWTCPVEDLPERTHNRWALILADPPYSADDAKKYGTRMVHRGKALAALARVTRPGGYVAWLDTVWPMHRKAEWRTAGRIAVVRSTNHRVRLLTIFERAAIAESHLT